MIDFLTPDLAMIHDYLVKYAESPEGPNDLTSPALCDCFLHVSRALTIFALCDPDDRDLDHLCGFCLDFLPTFIASSPQLFFTTEAPLLTTLTDAWAFIDRNIISQTCGPGERLHDRRTGPKTRMAMFLHRVKSECDKTAEVAQWNTFFEQIPESHFVAPDDFSDCDLVPGGELHWFHTQMSPGEAFDCFGELTDVDDDGFNPFD
jgi:hypothetical protein